MGNDPLFVFTVRKVGLSRWQVFYGAFDEEDETAHPTGPKFWRWKSAMHLRGTMQQLCNTAQWYKPPRDESDTRQLLKDHIDALPEYAEAVLLVTTPGEAHLVGTKPNLAPFMVLSMAKRIENRLN